MTTPQKLLLAICCLVLAGSTSIHATTVTLDTTPSWDGSSTIQPWGFTGTQTYGETVIVPGGMTRLNDFTFYIKGDPGTLINAQGEVYNWSGFLQGGHPPQGVSGAALFTGSSFLYTGNGAFQAITVSLPGLGLAVTPGEHIVMDLLALSGTGTTNWGDILFSHVANDGHGGFNFNNGPSSSATWDDFADFGDLAFKADFSGRVPDAGNSLLLLAMSFGLLAALKRRFQKA